MDNYCRLCLKSEDTLESIFESFENIDVPSLILTFCCIEIHKTDTFSKCICHSCLHIMLQMKDLREKSLENDKYLKSMVPNLVPEVKEELVDPELIKVEDNTENSMFLVVEDVSKEKPDESLKKENSSSFDDNFVSCGQPEADKSAEESGDEASSIYSLMEVEQDHSDEDEDDLLQEIRKDWSSSCENLDDENNLQDHMETFSLPSTEPEEDSEHQKCVKCDEEFSRAAHLKAHWKLYHDEILNRFRCMYCTYRFCVRGNAINHLRMVHQNLSSDGNVVFIQKKGLCAIFYNHIDKFAPEERSRLSKKFENTATDGNLLQKKRGRPRKPRKKFYPNLMRKPKVSHDNKLSETVAESSCEPKTEKEETKSSFNENLPQKKRGRRKKREYPNLMRRKKEPQADDKLSETPRTEVIRKKPKPVRKKEPMRLPIGKWGIYRDKTGKFKKIPRMRKLKILLKKLDPNQLEALLETSGINKSVE